MKLGKGRKKIGKVRRKRRNIKKFEGNWEKGKEKH